MAGYRPKSLDELNNLYDKALSAENEIKRKSSLLKQEVLKDSDERETVVQPAFVHTEKLKEISADVDSFIRQFSGEDESPQKGISFLNTEKRRPSPLSELQKNISEKESSPSEQREPVFEKKKPEAENSQKQQELSGLISDYARVMSGDYDDEEDDDLSSRKNLFKSLRSERRKGKKGGKEIVADGEIPAAEIEEKPQREEAPAPVYAPSFDPLEGTKVLFEDRYSDSPAKESPSAEQKEADEPLFTVPSDGQLPTPPQYEEPFLPEYEPQNEDNSFSGRSDESEPYDPELDEPYERQGNEEGFEFGEIETAKRSSRGRIAAKVILSLVLVLVLLATAATGACVFTVNSDRALPGGYLIFTAANSYDDAGVKSDDFVICKEQSPIEDGEKVIFINREYRSFSFGVKKGEKTDRNGNEFYIVSSSSIEKNDVLGVVSKTVPELGRLVKAVVDNFLYVLLGLVALAIIDTLVLCFAFKKRDDDYDYYDDGAPEEPDGETEGETEDDFGGDSLFSGIE